MHRDVKAENVLLSHRDPLQAECKLCDFGLSKFVKDEAVEKMTSAIGTVNYMAPESIDRGKEHAAILGLCKDQEVNGKKMDVFSTAILYSEIIQPTLEIFEGMSTLEVLLAVAREHRRPPLPENIHPTMEKLIRSMWDVDPSKRPHFTDILATLASLTEPAGEEANLCNVAETGAFLPEGTTWNKSDVDSKSASFPSLSSFNPVFKPSSNPLVDDVAAGLSMVLDSSSSTLTLDASSSTLAASFGDLGGSTSSLHSGSSKRIQGPPSDNANTPMNTGSPPKTSANAGHVLVDIL